MKSYNIGFPKKLSQIRIFKIKLFFQIFIFHNCVNNNFHSKRIRNTQNIISYFSKPYYSQSFSVYVNSRKLFVFKIEAFYLIYRFVDFPGKRKNQSESMLCYGIASVLRNIRYANPMVLTVIKIDMIKA